jgi:excinuclease ABC subunit B
VEGIEDGLAFQTLLGVTGSGKTFTMANVIARLGRPAIVFAPNKTLAAQLYASSASSFPSNAVEYFVSYYDYYQPEAYVPQRDLFIEKDSAINEHIEQMRLSCTKSLMERRDVVIVATVSAIYGIGNPSRLPPDDPDAARGRHNRPARHHRPAGAHAVPAQRTGIHARQLPRARRHDRRVSCRAFRAGAAHRTVRRRDRVPELFDPLTGAIRQKLARFTVYPSSHYVTPREQVLAALETIKEELRQRVEVLCGRGQTGGGAAHRAAHALRRRNAAGTRPLQGHRELHASPGRAQRRVSTPPTLTDYLPPDALMFVDESHVTIGQFGGMYNGDRSRKTNLVEFGFRLPSALDNRPLKFDEFETQDAPGGFRIGHAGRLREAHRAARWSSRWCARRAGRSAGGGATRHPSGG